MKEIQELEFITLQETPEERSHDFCPKKFEDYIGQKELKEKLTIYTQAAKMRGEALDHLLLFGPPGLGKTTLATIMASVMEVGIKICSGPMLERTGDLVAILSGLEARDILFIDEIHRMPTNVEEVLYNAMEHFRVDVIIGQGAGAKSVNLPINQFTLVGATTKTGMISAPLRSRFGIIEHLNFYTEEELQEIVLQSAVFLEMELAPESALLIGTCARGTPRIAKKILRRVRDYAQVNDARTSDITQAKDKVLSVSAQLVEQAIAFLGIDQDGLNKIDNLILRKILENFNGGPVGLETLASLIGEDRETIETVYEPFLLRKGYLEKTPRGRQISFKAIPYLKRKFYGQESLSWPDIPSGNR